jgi:hypothetical protein
MIIHSQNADHAVLPIKGFDPPIFSPEHQRPVSAERIIRDVRDKMGTAGIPETNEYATPIFRLISEIVGHYDDLQKYEKKFGPASGPLRDKVSDSIDAHFLDIIDQYHQFLISHLTPTLKSLQNGADGLVTEECIRTPELVNALAKTLKTIRDGHIKLSASETERKGESLDNPPNTAIIDNGFSDYSFPLAHGSPNLSTIIPEYAQLALEDRLDKSRMDAVYGGRTSSGHDYIEMARAELLRFIKSALQRDKETFTDVHLEDFYIYENNSSNKGKRRLDIYYKNNNLTSLMICLYHLNKILKHFKIVLKVRGQLRQK